MKPLDIPTSLADQVYETVAHEISEGSLPPGMHLVQDQLAERLGVSRQPVQQAMTRLRADGLVAETGRRGLFVAPLDPEMVRHHYGVRAALDGLAAQLAASRVAASSPIRSWFAGTAGRILRCGTRAIEIGDIRGQVRQDVALHTTIYKASGNPLLTRTAEPHWRFLRRAMVEVLRRVTAPAEIWTQHREIVEAILSGNAALAEARMLAHDRAAADQLYETLCKARGES